MSVLKIDRSVPFDPVLWLGPGWSIKRQSPTSATVHEIELERVRLSTEEFASGTPLDAYVFQRLSRKKAENEERIDAALIPLAWKTTINRSSISIHFAGTILVNPDGHEGILYIIDHPWERKGKGCWKYGCRLLINPWTPDHLFAMF